MSRHKLKLAQTWLLRAAPRGSLACFIVLFSQCVRQHVSSQRLLELLSLPCIGVGYCLPLLHPLALRSLPFFTSVPWPLWLGGLSLLSFVELAMRAQAHL